LNRFAATVLGDSAQSTERTHSDCGDIIEKDIGFVRRRSQSDPADIVEGLDRAFDPHHQRFLADLDSTSPVVRVVLHEALAQVGQ
jgi:hypothetical protein